MSRRYQLTPLAVQDVNDVVFYIAENFGLPRAEQARAEFVRTFRLLAQRPEIGSGATVQSFGQSPIASGRSGLRSLPTALLPTRFRSFVWRALPGSGGAFAATVSGSIG